MTSRKDAQQLVKKLRAQGFEVDMTSVAGQIDGAARYVQRSIKENEGNIQQIFAEYVGGHAAKMSTIGEYGRNYVDAAMKIYNTLTSAPDATAAVRREPVRHPRADRAHVVRPPRRSPAVSAEHAPQRSRAARGSLVRAPSGSCT